MIVKGLKMDRTLEVEFLEISRDGCGGFLRDNMESLHVILRLECLCGGIKTKRIRIFQTIRSRRLRIFEARSRSSDGEEGLRWQEVEAIYVRAGWDGCFDCSSVKVKFEDRSVYKLDCGDCPKVQIQFESVWKCQPFHHLSSNNTKSYWSYIRITCSMGLWEKQNLIENRGCINCVFGSYDFLP